MPQTLETAFLGNGIALSSSATLLPPCHQKVHKQTSWEYRCFATGSCGTGSSRGVLLSWRMESHFAGARVERWGP